jgi:hypothetical protein
MKQAEQQHIRRAVGVEVVNDGIDPLDRGVNPGVDLTQKIAVLCSSRHQGRVGCGAFADGRT